MNYRVVWSLSKYYFYCVALYICDSIYSIALVRYEAAKLKGDLHY